MYNIRNLKNKIISLALSFLLLFESTAFSLSLTADVAAVAEDKKADLQQIDVVLSRANTKNVYENNLNREAAAETEKVKKSAAAKKITALKADGKTKYGQLWPAYVRVAAKKEIAELSKDFNAYLGSYAASLEVMPYDLFEKQYKAAAEEEIKNNIRGKDAAFYKNKLAEVLSVYPIKVAYRQYKADALKEIKWRQNHPAKVQAAVSKVIEEYLKVLGGELLPFNTLAALNGLELNGAALLTPEVKKSALNYHILHLSRQDLKKFEPSLLSNKEQQKLAVTALGEIAESLMSGAILCGENNAAFTQSAKSLIERSEDTSLFGEVLSLGFAALVSAKAWTDADKLLSSYTKKELEGAAWYEYLDLTLYAKKLKTHGVTYLGKVSSKTQYKSQYAYHNVFSDLAAILSEDGSSEALTLLKRYSVERDVNKVIKPFLAGALLSKKCSLLSDNSSLIALELANLDLADITATEEYDLDNALLRRYPGIKSALLPEALITKEAAAGKKSYQEKFAYLERAALSGDIILALYGAVGLFKMTVKGAGLARSTYTVIKAARITDSAKRFAYLKANYAKAANYINAKKSLLRFKTDLKLFLGRKIDYRSAAKLQNDLNAKALTRLNQENNAALQAAQFNPAPQVQAKAAVAKAAYIKKQAEIDLLNKYRLYNTTGTFADQHNVFISRANYANRSRDLGNAAKKYYETLGTWDRFKISLASKAGSLWNGLNAMFNHNGLTQEGRLVRYLKPGYLNRDLYNIDTVSEIKNLPAVVSKPVFNTELSTGDVLPSFMTNPSFMEQIRGSVFEIFSHKGHGTGFYVDYKGAKFIFTAAHVLHAESSYPLLSPYAFNPLISFMPEAKLFKLTNAFGRSGKAVVVYQNTSITKDLAILVPEPSLIKGLTPFKISLKEPAAGNGFAIAGYPEHDGFVLMRQEIPGTIAINFPSHPGYYLGMPGIRKGFSGGPLISEGGVFGVAVKSDLKQESYYVRMPVIRDFLSRAFKDLFIDYHFNKMAYFRENPVLFARYKNIIGKYNYAMNTSVVTSPRPYYLDLLRPFVLQGRFMNTLFKTPRVGIYGKKAGFSFLKGLGISPRNALNSMYYWGAAPEHSILPVLSANSQRLTKIVPSATKNAFLRAVPYPAFYSRHNSYKGIALTAEEIEHILKNGLSVEKYTAPAAKTKQIIFTENSAEAFSSSLIGAEGEKIPVVFHMRNAALTSAKDIPPQDIYRISVLLDNNGVPVWGELTLKDGLTYFTPYM